MASTRAERSELFNRGHDTGEFSCLILSLGMRLVKLYITYLSMCDALSPVSSALSFRRSFLPLEHAQALLSYAQAALTHAQAALRRSGIGSNTTSAC